MSTITITEILDDLRAADEITRRFERHYWPSSADFYELYSQGLLDDGEHTEDFALWAGFYEIKIDREKDLARARHQFYCAQLAHADHRLHRARSKSARRTIRRERPGESPIMNRQEIIQALKPSKKNAARLACPICASSKPSSTACPSPSPEP